MSTQAIIDENLQVVVFNLNHQEIEKKEYYAVPIEQVKEIRSLEKITKVPNSQDSVLGIINLRGMIIPVVDVNKKLGFVGKWIDKNSTQQILVAEIKESLIGFLVDEVEAVMRVSAKDIEAAPSGEIESYRYIKGIAKTKEKLIVILDITKIVDPADSDIKPEENIVELSPQIQTEDDSSLPPEDPTPGPDSSNEQKEQTDDIPDVLKEVFEEEEKDNSHVDCSE